MKLLLLLLLLSCGTEGQKFGGGNILDIPMKLAVKQCVDVDKGYVCMITMLDGRTTPATDIDICYFKTATEGEAMTIPCAKYNLIKNYAVED